MKGLSSRPGWRGGRAVALAALALVFAIAAPAGPASAADPFSRMLARINHHRARHDLPPVAPDRLLARAAQSHAEDMAAGDFFAHRGSDGSDLAVRLGRAGYAWWVAAENIAAGIGAPEKTVDGWMKSDGHRHNLLMPELREAGIGYAFVAKDGGRARYRHYWTLTLGARR